MRIGLYLAFVCVGLSIGGISGVMGIGGGVLLVPILMWGFGFGYLKATGTSLAILAPPVVLPAAWRAYRDNHVDLLAAICIAVAFACGGYLGRGVVKHLPAEALRVAFGFLMLLVAVRFIFSGSNEATSAAVGLVSVALAWCAYAGLRMLGRKHLPEPSLTEKIQQAAQQKDGQGEPEYYI